MSSKSRHLSKTDLRRGLFTKGEKVIDSQPVKGEIATGTDEQMLLFGEVATATPAHHGQRNQSPTFRQNRSPKNPEMTPQTSAAPPT